MKQAESLSPAEARVICEALDLDAMMTNKEESEMLREQNPELWFAYRRLLRISAK